MQAVPLPGSPLRVLGAPDQFDGSAEEPLALLGSLGLSGQDGYYELRLKRRLFLPGKELQRSFSSSWQRF